MAVHQTTAEGLCQSYHVDYLSAHNFSELQEQMAQFVQRESDRPVLFEVFTDADGDTGVYNDYYRGLCTEKWHFFSEKVDLYNFFCNFTPEYLKVLLKGSN